MAYDEILAARIRELLGDEPGLSEQRMFGGLAFLLDGRLAAAASRRRALMVRVPEQADVDPLLRPVEMRGRVMTGWYETTPDGDLGDAELARLLVPAVEYVRSLPPKGEGD